MKKKLSEYQETLVQEMYLKGKPQDCLSKEFKVSKITIWRTIHKKIPVSNNVGENNNRSVLTEENVKEMRLFYKTQDISYYQLAAIFGVDKTTAYRAVMGKTWKHI